MADCITALITQNLRATLNGKSFTYNGLSHTSTCERQRRIRHINDRYPFIELFGPQVETLHRTSVSTACNLHYLIEFRDERIDDSYKADSDVSTMTEIADNIAADIQMIVVEDITRGGYAELTTWGDHGHYFVPMDNGDSEFVIYQEITVLASIKTDDPYTRG